MSYIHWNRCDDVMPEVPEGQYCLWVLAWIHHMDTPVVCDYIDDDDHEAGFYATNDTHRFWDYGERIDKGGEEDAEVTYWARIRSPWRQEGDD